MAVLPKTLKRLTVLAFIIAAIWPAALYWFLVGRVPAVTPDQARDRLRADPAAALVVDVRSKAGYDREHIAGAVHWPYEDALALKSIDDLPAALRGRILFMVCGQGFRSARTVDRLIGLGLTRVYNVRGGIQEWKGMPEVPDPEPPRALVGPNNETRPLPFRESPALDQWALVVTAFGVKPLYMLLSFLIIIRLWLLRSPDMVSLRRAMIFFLAGEAACAVNYLFFGEDSYLVEYLHMAGMAAAFGYAAHALFEALDRRVFRLSDPARRCAALELCGECLKYSDAPCKARRVFLVLALMAALLALPPLQAPILDISYNTQIVGAPYHHSHPAVYQIFETRHCPVAAFIFLIASFLWLWLKKTDPLAAAKIWFSAGVGALGFAWFRMVLLSVYRDQMAWFNNWEEITELMFVAGLVAVLWIFRRTVFNETRLEAASD